MRVLEINPEALKRMEINGNPVNLSGKFIKLSRNPFNVNGNHINI